MQQGMIIGWIGIIGMSLALWTTGDANLYLPVIQTSSILKRPKHVMTVICGILGKFRVRFISILFRFPGIISQLVPH
ncbi:MAG: hypothetical protein Ct9H300mP6_14610 [Gammaproteobacteria bacterium]|nr:MAG: hypothetical protein Ct9H300mP6_14610 [Gammaproteobacteria bacterium]